MFLLISSMSNILSARNHMQIEYCGNVHPGLERSTRELKYLNQNILSARMLLLVVLILWLKLPSMWFSSLVYPRLQDTASTTMPLRQMRQIRGSLVESQHPTNCTDIKAQAAPAFEDPDCWEKKTSCIRGMRRSLASSLWPGIYQKRFPEIGVPQNHPF